MERLTTVHIAILAALAKGEELTPGIVARISRLTGGRLRLSLDRLHTNLERLKRKKLVKARWKREPIDLFIEREHFTLTRCGRREIADIKTMLS